jgi:hypothetical protein
MIYPLCPLCKIKMLEIIDIFNRYIGCKNCLLKNWFKPAEENPMITGQFCFSFKDKKTIYSLISMSGEIYHVRFNQKLVGSISRVPLLINDDLPKEAEKLADKIIRIRSFL